MRSSSDNILCIKELILTALTYADLTNSQPIFDERQLDIEIRTDIFHFQYYDIDRQPAL